MAQQEESAKTMKAVWLEKKESIEIKSIAIPKVPSNGIRIKMERAHILSFTNIAVAGYLPNTPFPCVLGPSSIGTIDEIGQDVSDCSFKKNQRVLATPSIGIFPNAILQGWLGFGTPTANKLQSIYRNGTFAEYSIHPSFNIYPIPSSDGSSENELSLEQLSLANYYSIAYGGLYERGQLQNGESVIIGGATGGLGKCCLFLSLALGAAKIYIMGRNNDSLNELQKYDKKRIKIIDTSKIKYDESEKKDDKKDDKIEVTKKYIAEILSSNGDGEGVNLYVDAYGGLPDASLTVGAINNIKSFGRGVLMGGSMHDLPINYSSVMLRNIDIRGAFMYTKDAPKKVLSMMVSGALNTEWIKTESFKLEEAETAISNAQKWKGSKFAILKNE